MPKLFLGNAAVLSLFATGRTTGTVIDSGEGITHTVPIYEGFAIPPAIKEIPICGADLTKYLHTILNAKYPTDIPKNTEGIDEIIKIKEMKGKVALDFDAELKQVTDAGASDPRDYKLPTGVWIQVNEECLRCPELLFSPGLQQNASTDDGLQQHCFNSIMKCENDVKKGLFQNIVLAGGCTMFEGIQKRMEKEIQALAPSTMGPQVSSPADRKHSAWLGGAILSSIDRFDAMWITKKDFDEQGKHVVHKKCF